MVRAALTSCLKPLSQLVSHIPQLVECKRLKTTHGISFFSQGLNFVGGVAGTAMCLALPPKSPWTWLLYGNSIFQAMSLFFMALYYDGGIKRFTSKKPESSSSSADDLA